MSQTKHSFVVRGKSIFFIYVTTLAYIICMVNKSFMFNISGFVIVVLLKLSVGFYFSLRVILNQS